MIHFFCVFDLARRDNPLKAALEARHGAQWKGVERCGKHGNSALSRPGSNSELRSVLVLMAIMSRGVGEQLLDIGTNVCGVLVCSIRFLGVAVSQSRAAVGSEGRWH